MDQMTPDELRAHVSTLREVSSSPITLKKHLSNKKQEAKAAKTTTPKQTGADLANKYLNLGKKAS